MNADGPSLIDDGCGASPCHEPIEDADAQPDSYAA